MENKKRSLEYRKRISESLKKAWKEGRCRKTGIPLSEEHKSKIGLSQLGKKKKRLNEGRKPNKWNGVKRHTSLETRIRMSISAKKRYGANKKSSDERGSFEYKLWREAVLSRDKFKCNWCGKSNVKLIVDHIKPFSLYKKHRLVLKNGRTLCAECNKKRNKIQRPTLRRAMLIKELLKYNLISTKIKG